MYRHAVLSLQQVAPTDPDAKLDEDWIERTTKELRKKTDALEQELKSYKNNMIKESIRVCPPTALPLLPSFILDHLAYFVSLASL